MDNNEDLLIDRAMPDELKSLMLEFQEAAKDFVWAAYNGTPCESMFERFWRANANLENSDMYKLKRNLPLL